MAHPRAVRAVFADKLWANRCLRWNIYCDFLAVVRLRAIECIRRSGDMVLYDLLPIDSIAGSSDPAEGRVEGAECARGCLRALAICYEYEAKA